MSNFLTFYKCAKNFVFDVLITLSNFPSLILQIVIVEIYMLFTFTLPLFACRKFAHTLFEVSPTVLSPF